MSKKIYEEILNGIARRNNLTDEATRSRYLRDLQPVARRLWMSYRKQDVSVDYTDRKIQESYLLRYFPF